MNPTHKLPKHLGGWPCTIHPTAANDGMGQMLTLVEYEVSTYKTSPAAPRRMYIDPAELERIMPAEPDAPYVVGADGIVYVRLGGHEPGTGERLWVDITSVRGARPLTWGALTVAWEEENKQQRIIPLVPDPLTEAPELPWRGTGNSGGIEIDISERGAQDLEPIKLEMDESWSWLRPEEAEQMALALLRAVADVRKQAS